MIFSSSTLAIHTAPHYKATRVSFVKQFLLQGNLMYLFIQEVPIRTIDVPVLESTICENFIYFWEAISLVSGKWLNFNKIELLTE